MSETVVKAHKKRRAGGVKTLQEAAEECLQEQQRLKREFMERDAQRSPGGWRLPSGRLSNTGDVV